MNTMAETKAHISRPLSPHLQIYRLTLTMLMSIVHRITGFGLYFGMILVAWWFIAAAGPNGYARFQWFIGSWIGLLMLFGWTFCLFFHLCNGIRHMAWDLGLGFEKAQYIASGWMVAGASAILTVLVWIVGLVIW